MPALGRVAFGVSRKLQSYEDDSRIMNYDMNNVCDVTPQMWQTVIIQTPNTFVNKHTNNNQTLAETQKQLTTNNNDSDLSSTSILPL